MPECLYIKMYPQNLNPRDIERAVEVLKRGGVIIYPTDTVYGIGCDITNTKAVERIIKIKGMKPKEAIFSFICHDRSHIAIRARVENRTFRPMKTNLPAIYLNPPGLTGFRLLSKAAVKQWVTAFQPSLPLKLSVSGKPHLIHR